MDFTPIGIDIHIGSFMLPLRYYGFILITGAFAGGWLAARLAQQKRGHHPDLVWDGLIWALLGGIIGARLWHILTPPPSMVAMGYDTLYYLNLANMQEVNFGFTFSIPAAFALMNGGLGIPGAVAGGMVGFYIYARAAKLNFIEWVDYIAPGLALGQAIGRWGNFVNQELYGAPTTLPWGLEIDALHRVTGYTDPALRFHPLFLYESLGNLAICGGLLYLGKRFADRLKMGDIFLLYLIFYPLLRFSLEFVRLDSSMVWGLNANQSLMLVVALCAGGALFMRHSGRRVRGAPPTPPAVAASQDEKA